MVDKSLKAAGKRRLPVIMCAAVVSVLPFTGVAAHAAPSGYGDKPPVSGQWKIISDQSGGPAFLTGRFVVTPHHGAVRAFTATPGPDAASQCGGSQPVSLVGRSKIHHYHGVNRYRLHYSVWAVGKEDPKVQGQMQPTKVTLERAGHRIPGQLMLVFHNPRGGRPTGYGPPKSEAELSYRLSGQSRCDLGFLFKKA